MGEQRYILEGATLALALWWLLRAALPSRGVVLGAAGLAVSCIAGLGYLRGALGPTVAAMGTALGLLALAADIYDRGRLVEKARVRWAPWRRIALGRGEKRGSS